MFWWGLTALRTVALAARSRRSFSLVIRLLAGSLHRTGFLVNRFRSGIPAAVVQISDCGVSVARRRCLHHHTLDLHRFVQRVTASRVIIGLGIHVFGWLRVLCVGSLSFCGSAKVQFWLNASQFICNLSTKRLSQCYRTENYEKYPQICVADLAAIVKRWEMQQGAK